MCRRYLILGASSDLGLEFLRNGKWFPDDEVLVQYCRSRERLETVVQELPCKVQLLQADFLQAESLQGFIAQLQAAAYVPTHILHIPALPIENKRFTEYSWQEAENQLMVQVRSFYEVMQAVLPGMIRRKNGRVVAILTSYSVAVPPRFLSVYVMAKYALMGLMKALAAEYAPKHLQFNMVSPSMMETRFVEGIYQPVIQQSAAANPMKRNALVSDVVPLLQYLFSEENSFMTGVNIPVAGGEVF